jgi:glycosyltransferase involved in cell wall biosynthesis
LKPRVLQFTNTFHPTGSERQAVQITRLLHQSSRYDVQMACMRPEGLMLAEIERLNLGELPAFPLNSFYDFNAIRQLARFAAFLRRQRIDIVQTHDFYTNVFGMMAAWIARVPVRIAARRETTGWRTPAQLRVEHFVYSLSHAIVANAEAVRAQLLKEEIGREKIVTIYNGLNLDRLVPRLDRREALKLFNLPAGDECRYITVMANLLHPVKDYPTFLRAAQIVRKEIPQARFVSGGVGPLTDEMRALASQLGLEKDVFFIGWCEQVAEMLAVSDVCVLSSKAEGFSNSIIEYMAAGRPVVVTDVGGAREAVIEGETGFLVQTGDYEAMAARIIELLRAPEKAREMGRRARRVVEQKFSCTAQLEGTERLYERLLARTARRMPAESKTVPQESAEWLSK